MSRAAAVPLDQFAQANSRGWSQGADGGDLTRKLLETMLQSLVDEELVRSTI